MTKSNDKTPKKTEKLSLKITKKDSSKKTKKVILEAPLLEQFSPTKNNNINIKNKPEQIALGSLSDVRNNTQRKKLNISLRPVTPRPNTQMLIGNVSNTETNDNEDFDFISNDSPNEIPEELENSTVENVDDEYDFISTETPDIYKTNFSFEDNIISEEIENIKAFPVSSDTIPTTDQAVFKEFSFENSNNVAVESIHNIIELPKNVEKINNVLENFDNNTVLNNNFDFSASPSAIAFPTVDESILNSKEASIEPSQDIFTNIITPEANNYVEDHEEDNIVNSDNILEKLSDEELDKELSEILEIEENNNENNNDDFSIEEYFGVTSSKDEQENIDDFEEEQDEDSSLPKLEQPQITSFSKLIENFTETISSLSTKISNLEANIAENEYNKQVQADNYIENLINTKIDDIDLEALDKIQLDDIDINDVPEISEADNIEIENISEPEIEAKEEVSEENVDSVEDILTKAFDNSNIDDQMKQELISEVLSSNEPEQEDLSKEENTIAPEADSDHISDFFKVIDSLSKTISELESSQEDESAVEKVEEFEEESILPNEKQTSLLPKNPSEKAINILINKDDIFSIEISNETYEIVTDFDGISVLSENIHISTPKNNFYVSIGEKYIEIHKQPDLFVVNTNFEDIEFANAINNVTFTKKKNKIELNIKEAFKISSINKKIELSMLNTSIANLAGGQTQSNSDNSSVCDNKTLIINEETQKVYLPYTIEEVMKKLNNSSDYQSIQDVVDQEYTLPLSTFKMPIISRFKEAYRFMRVKEKSSVYAALDLAIELMFNSNLNPAIIRAAKDLKELNIYLDCLYENELEKFDCFKIIYKVLPKIE